MTHRRAGIEDLPMMGWLLPRLYHRYFAGPRGLLPRLSHRYFTPWLKLTSPRLHHGLEVSHLLPRLYHGCFDGFSRSPPFTRLHHVLMTGPPTPRLHHGLPLVGGLLPRLCHRYFARFVEIRIAISPTPRLHHGFPVGRELPRLHHGLSLAWLPPICILID